MRTIKQLTAYAAAALLCGALCTGASADIFSREFTNPDDFSAGIFDHTEVSPGMGGLVLNKSINTVPFIWVPSPSTGIVSKIDARTGSEIARYRTGPEDGDWSPCAIATDLEGNAYVACGSEGTGKIVKILASGSSRSIMQTPGATSFDFNANGIAEALPWGSDSRVSLVTEIGTKGSRPSSLAFDDNGNLWVGLWGEQSLAMVDVNRKAVVATVPVDGRPETMLVGPRGMLWVLCKDNSTICQVNSLLGVVVGKYDLGDSHPNSICLGDDGILWIGSDDGLICFETSCGSFTIQKLTDGAGIAGVTTDSTGDVWAACPMDNKLIRFSATDLSIAATVNVGLWPNSVCSDQDGYLWVLNQNDSTASRVDPRTNTAVTSTYTALGPCSSTPFSSHVLVKGMSPSGGWDTLVDSGISGAGWGKIAWQSGGAGRVKVQARSANTPSRIAESAFVDVTNGESFNVPNGRYLEVRVSIMGGGNTTPILRNLLVQGRNLPPDVSQATPTTARILKINHTFEPVSITGIKDPEGDPVVVTITGVTQDEPVIGASVDDKGPDAIGIGTSEVKLRGEFDTGSTDKPGNGRVYTISFRATDALGASSTGKVKVTVPVSLRTGDVAFDDGQKYDSTKGPALNVANSVDKQQAGG